MTAPDPESFTLADLRNMRHFNPAFADMADFLLVASLDSFTDLLIRHIDEWIAFAEEDPGVRASDGEDRLTIDLIGYLRGKGYDASHDEKIGGHSDVVVRHRNGYIWLGEAKIHKDYDWLSKGFSQLSTRYSPGTPNASKGGLLIFILNKDAESVMQNWRALLRSMSLTDFTDRDCGSKRGPFAFFSTHKHESSGLPYTIRHMGVVLHFDPKDRS